IDAAALIAMQRALEQVHVSDAIDGYIVDLVTATRDSKQLAVGASPRGSLALLKLSRAKAAVDGRDFVVPEDVKAVAVPALAHRLTMRPELWVQRIRGDDNGAAALEPGLTSPVGADRVDVLLPLPAELRSVGINPRAVVLRAGEGRTLEYAVRCERWGAFVLGPVFIRARDRLAFHSWETRIGAAQALRV